ncbi:hypothetical protein Leryth_015157 [Lithospermum erythrorhizon]|nr:hypothetical protein Leryth_015157 [Lithospermum erythrorhizon]
MISLSLVVLMQAALAYLLERSEAVKWLMGRFRFVQPCRRAFPGFLVDHAHSTLCLRYSENLSSLGQCRFTIELPDLVFVPLAAYNHANNQSKDATSSTLRNEERLVKSAVAYDEEDEYIIIGLSKLDVIGRGCCLFPIF